MNRYNFTVPQLLNENEKEKEDNKKKKIKLEVDGPINVIKCTRQCFHYNPGIN